MTRSLSSVLGGVALGLVLALSVGVTMGTLCSFAGFAHAVRPGAKEALLGRALSTGTSWAELTVLIAVPACAIWLRQRDASAS